MIPGNLPHWSAAHTCNGREFAVRRVDFADGASQHSASASADNACLSLTLESHPSYSNPLWCHFYVRPPQHFPRARPESQTRDGNGVEYDAVLSSAIQREEITELVGRTR
jgi:hypothetical protein